MKKVLFLLLITVSCKAPKIFSYEPIVAGSISYNVVLQRKAYSLKDSTRRIAYYTDGKNRMVYIVQRKKAIYIITDTTDGGVKSTVNILDHMFNN